jgi:hypothetical protein
LHENFGLGMHHAFCLGLQRRAQGERKRVDGTVGNAWRRQRALGKSGFLLQTRRPSKPPMLRYQAATQTCGIRFDILQVEKHSDRLWITEYKQALSLRRASMCFIAQFSPSPARRLHNS